MQLFDFWFFFNSILLGVGLAMDAFSVSLANGLREPKMRLHKLLTIAGVFAAFQAVMPLIGWICVHTIASHFRAFEVCVPWVAFLLLLWIGGKMLWDGIRHYHAEEPPAVALTGGLLMTQGLATSIDALSVGFTISEYTLPAALLCALLIALVTFGICLCGLLLGKTFGTRFSKYAGILGGVILIAIGLEILLGSF